jgi:WD40 repeat protein/predicted Ser/Thr protein kinase
VAFAPGLDARLPSGESREPAVDEPVEDLLSRTFGDYRLIKRIGQGGMGVVYKAQQTSLGRTVALKMLPFGPFTRDDFVKRFHTEAQAAAKLQHPNIVAIYEVGEREGQHFFSMEFVDGLNLAEVVGNQPMPEARAVRITRTIAEAVQFAHEHGILHRDLKPSNILLDPLDQPRITDFGLAKDLADDSELTMTGQALGSPSYIPPEQAEGRRAALGPRGDVYSLGAILYHLLTGRAPFAGESITATVQQVINDEPVAPRLLNRAVPRDLEVICLKCLEKEPARRYTSAKELAEELGRFQNDEPIRARPVSAVEKLWRWCRRRPALAGVTGAAALCLIGGLIISTWQWRRAELQAQNVSAALVQAKIRKAEDLFSRGQSGAGLAWLAHVLREQPDNRGAAERLTWALTYRDFPLPLTFGLRHGDRLNSARFNPAGTRVLTAGRDGTARLWDAASGQPVGLAMKHSATVFDATFSPDGRYILTRSDDGSSRVWSAITGEPVGPVIRHQAAVTWAGFTADGNVFATVSQDATARAWKTISGEPTTPLLKHEGAIMAAALTRQGRLVTCSMDSKLRVWNLSTGDLEKTILRGADRRPLQKVSPDGRIAYLSSGTDRVLMVNLETDELVGTPPSHERAIFAMDVNLSGSRLLTASEDRTARVWDAATGQPVTPPLVHEGPVMAAVFSPDGHRVATASADGTARLWDAVTGATLGEPMRHPSLVADIAFSVDGQRVVTASWDGSARVWAVPGGGLKPVTLTHGRAIRHVEFSADGREVVTAGEDDTARVWDAQTGRPVGDALRHERRVIQAVFDGEARRVATASWDKTARVWDAQTGAPLTKPLAHGDFVLFAQFSADGRTLLTGARNGEATVWDAVTGRMLSGFTGHTAAVVSGEFTRDGRRIATASRDGTGRVWEPTAGRELLKLEHEGEVTSVRFDALEQRLVTGGEDWSARIWDAQTGKELTPPLRHLNNVHYAEFGPDGRLVVTASVDATARLWDASTGVALPVVLQHADEVLFAHFSPDGSRLLTASEDGTARLWDVKTGLALSEALRHGDNVRSVCFSPDGARIATASDDGTARIWPLPEVRSRLPDWLIPLAEAVGALRVDSAGALAHVSADELMILRRQVTDRVEASDQAKWLNWFFADRQTRSRSPWGQPASGRP